MSVVILGLITIFLFKEGIEFFSQYRQEMNIYRASGMEYANVVSKQHDSQTLLFRYIENILSKETRYYDSLSENSPDKKVVKFNKDNFLKFANTFQQIKDKLLNYEKEVVSWAAETKLFLNTQTTILSLKSEAEKLGLPEEDFNQSIENLKRAEYFSHSDLERWYYYFIRQDQENLAFAEV